MNDPGLREQPILALSCALIAIGLLVAAIFVRGTDHLLLRNWLATMITTCCVWIMFVFVIPRRAPGVNSYLWSEPGGRVPLRFSVSVALVAFFIAFSTIAGLLLTARFRHTPVTAYPSELWMIIAASAIAPTCIGIYLGLSQAGATERFAWLDFARPFLASSRSQFSDNGRLFITLVAATTIMFIQGGVVLTGGLSTSFFSFLLFSVGGVAALASDRPAYAIFAVVVVLCAALSTEVIGSYPPPSMAYYPFGHVAMFSLSLLIGLLIDLGRKGKPEVR